MLAAGKMILDMHVDSSLLSPHVVSQLEQPASQSLTIKPYKTENLEHSRMSTSFARKGARYAPAELEVVLSMVPTSANVMYLSTLLCRTPDAIKIIFRLAFQHGDRFGKTATSQRKKIAEAARRVGLAIGRRH